MQISKRHIHADFENYIKHSLAQVIADIPTKEKAYQFLEAFLTQTEFVAMAKRLAIVNYLHKGRSYEEIKSEIKVSSATIANIQNQLEKKTPGLQLATKLINAEEWASKWADKITGFFAKPAPPQAAPPNQS